VLTGQGILACRCVCMCEVGSMSVGAVAGGGAGKEPELNPIDIEGTKAGQARKLLLAGWGWCESEEWNEVCTCHPPLLALHRS
jgi:hypothetical protein